MTVTTYPQTNGDDGSSDGSSGTGVVEATVAEIAALAIAGTLVPGGIYFDSATGTHYLASSTTEYAPLAASTHLGLVTLATALAYPSPTAGLTADVSDILPSAEPIRIRYNGTAWKAQQAARVRLRGANAGGGGTQYPTNTRWALPTGAVGLFSAMNAKLLFTLLDSPDTDTITSWRLKIGTAGTAADTDVSASTGTPLAAADNQRPVQNEFEFESATTIRCNGSSLTGNAGNASATAVTGIGAAAITISDITSSALYIGVDYTQGAFTNVATLTATYTLIP